MSKLEVKKTFKETYYSSKNFVQFLFRLHSKYERSTESGHFVSVLLNFNKCI